MSSEFKTGQIVVRFRRGDMSEMPFESILLNSQIHNQTVNIQKFQAFLTGITNECLQAFRQHLATTQLTRLPMDWISGVIDPIPMPKLFIIKQFLKFAAH
jgi:hypothetical protein